ncbi:hypothetical protein [Paraburkholderia caledonica]|uniref:hypothetical protein n=1 Tax=Paraburkholderia caledonica TaxID=134536 RepID=UPI0038B71797
MPFVRSSSNEGKRPAVAAFASMEQARASAEQTQTRQRKEYHRADRHRQHHARGTHPDQTEPDHLSYAIIAVEGAHNAPLDLEELVEKDLTRFRKQYENLAKEARTALREGGSDTDSPFVAHRELGDEKRRDADSDGGVHNKPAKRERKD